jgi:hypothetical protein
MDEIIAAGALLQRGEREAARAKLQALLARIEHAPDPMHECSLAHLMADVQDSPADELAWDLRSLDAALRCTDADVQRHSQAVSVSAFMPSIHTSIAQDYFKLGDLEQSRIHLESARTFADHLSDDSYGQLIRHGMERLARQLGGSLSRSVGRGPG